MLRSRNHQKASSSCQDNNEESTTSTTSTTSFHNHDNNSKKRKKLKKNQTLVLVVVSLFLIVLLSLLPLYVSKQQQLQQQQISIRIGKDKTNTQTVTLHNNKKEEQQPSSQHENNKDIHIFIGIKTSIKGVHGSRFAQSYHTWLQDIPPRKSKVTVKFFGEVDGTTNQTIIDEWMVPFTTQLEKERCVRRQKSRGTLCCKDQIMYQYYYEHYANRKNSNQFSPWFCSFDDDNYILVDNLIQVLTSYQHQSNVTKLFLGRPSTSKGMNFKVEENKTERVFFLTGGAGYCISREAMMFGQDVLSNLFQICQAKRAGIPDDVAIGYAMNTKVGVHQQLEEHFHSHLEKIQTTIPQKDIGKQVSFGYDNKKERDEAVIYFPNVPIVYSQDEDPMLFKSLRTFLLQQQQQQQ